MGCAQEIDKGNELRDEKKYEQAIIHYDNALREQAGSFKAHFEKSVALHRLKRFEDALASLHNAEVAASNRSQRSLYGQVLFRYAVIHNAQNHPQTAIKFLNLAAQYEYEEKEITLWRFQIKQKAEKLKIANFKTDDSFSNLEEALELTKKYKKDIPLTPVCTATLSKTSSIKSSTSETTPATSGVTVTEAAPTSADDIAKQKKELEKKMSNKDNLFPATKDIKKDWFQSLSQLTVSLFIKNLPKDDNLKVKFTRSSISVEFPTSPTSEFQYEIGPFAGNIIPKECSYKVFGTKVEFYLPKESEVKWKNLERSDSEAPVGMAQNDSAATRVSSSLAYPNSSKSGIDWSKMTIDEDDDSEVSKDENAFFKELYKNADDDTRRAMQKSFVESGGTSLSTNWEDVSKKTFEISPPDGMEAREW